MGCALATAQTLKSRERRNRNIRNPSSVYDEAERPTSMITISGPKTTRPEPLDNFRDCPRQTTNPASTSLRPVAPGRAFQ